MTITFANAEAGNSVRNKLNSVLVYARSVTHPDFGAAGDGVTDDTTAINNACAAGNGTGVVVFPSGTYLISGSIDLDDVSGPRSIILRGVGNSSIITGNFAGFLIDRNDVGSPVANSPEQNGIVIEDLKFNNSSSNAAAGCVRINQAMNIGIINCRFNGVRCIVIDDNTFSAVVERCVVNGFDYGENPKAGIGIVMGCNQGRITECDIVGHAEGARVRYGGQISNCRIEVNVVGLTLGQDPTGGTHAFSGLISSNSFEANDTAIHVYSFNNGHITCGSIQGAETGQGTPAPQPAGGTGQAHYGIRIRGGQNVKIENITIGGGFVNGGVVSDNAAPINYRLEGVDCNGVTVGTSFVFTAGHMGGMTLIDCGGLTDAQQQLTYSQLASYEAGLSGANALPIGTRRYVSNSDTTTWGATIADAGAGGNPVVAVKATSSVWKVDALI